MNDARWLFERLRTAAVAVPVASLAAHCAGPAAGHPPGFDPAGSHADPVLLTEPTRVDTSVDPPQGGFGTSAADLSQGMVNDADGDGFLGPNDPCPFEPEDFDGFADEGCPDPDNDGDGIPDLVDQCPDQPELAGDWNLGDGCPGGGYYYRGYYYRNNIVIGRPLVDDGINLRADTRIASTWVQVRPDDLAARLTDEQRRFFARRWEGDGRLEHASVASFARASLELMAAGAPPELVAGAHEAALDEVRHARACFGLAARYADAPRSPGPMQVAGPRDLTLAELAVRTFLEGCVEESVATLCALRQHAACVFPAVRDVLSEIVEDESRHAALAWRTVAWALREGGDDVAQALRNAAANELAEVRERAEQPGRTPVIDVALMRRHGRLPGALQRRTALDAWKQVITPLLDDAIAAA